MGGVLQAMPRNFYTILSITLIVCVLALSSIVLQEQYYLVSLAILLLGFIPLFARLETGTIKGRELVLIAVLSALAAVSRVPFSFLPSIQPSSMIVMATGWVFGPRVGWVVGANVALVSNFFLGQGPWTPWQMFAWSLMGLTAGLLRNRWWMKRMSGKIFFGFIWGILFGWIMNFWVVVGGLGSLEAMSFLQAFAASVLFDMGHAISNVVFIWWMWKPMEKILLRFQVKYGLLK